MKVIIYTRTACSECVKAKNFFKNNGVQYEEKSFDNNPEAMKIVQENSFTSLPIILIDGKPFSGYNEAELRKALGIK